MSKTCNTHDEDEKWNPYGIFSESVTKSLRRCRRRWKNNIKKDLEKIGYEHVH